MAEFEIEAAMVDVPVKGGAFKAYRALPKGAGPQPGVIVIHDFRGLADHTKEIAGRLARAGYVALAVDLFSRGPRIADPDDLDAYFARMNKLPDGQAVEDLVAARRYLHGIPQVGARRVGAIGFCMGGLYAFLLGCADDMLSAVADFYGMLTYEQTSREKPVSPIERAGNLKCPLLGLFGDQDGFIPIEQIQDLEARLAKAGKTHEIHVYEGCGHAFFNDTRPDAYRPDAARDAWAKTLEFFARHLRA